MVIFAIGCVALERAGLFGTYHASNSQSNWAHSGQ
jgi:hypothetical protein